MAGRGDARIEVDGLADLRRGLRNIDRSLGREVNHAVRDALKPTAALAASLAPHRTGRLAASIRSGAAGNRAYIASRLPYANVIHWGGNVPDRRSLSKRPKRHFEATLFAEKAIERRQDQLVDEVADQVDALARRHGFR